MMIFNKMFLACTLSKRSELIGFCVLFCQYQQETVGASIYTLVKSVFNGSDIPNEVNKTFIILITRANQPSYLKIYHLINLSTVIYKTIIKIMANRLKTIIPDLIVLTVCFGKHVIENIVINYLGNYPHHATGEREVWTNAY